MAAVFRVGGRTKRWTRFDKFDGTNYLKHNPDVAAYVDANLSDFSGGRSNGAIAHYLIYGANEGWLGFDITGVAIEQAILIEEPGCDAIPHFVHVCTKLLDRRTSYFSNDVRNVLLFAGIWR